MTSQLPLFRCLFLSCQQQKNTKNKAAETSLRSFLFCDDFSIYSQMYKSPKKEKEFNCKKTMISAKFVFSIKIRKLLDFAFVFRGQNEENPFKNRIQKRVVLKHRIWRVFPPILGAFGRPKIKKNRNVLISKASSEALSL